LVHTAICIPTDVVVRIKAAAEVKGTSMSAEIRECLTTAYSSTDRSSIVNCNIIENKLVFSWFGRRLVGGKVARFKWVRRIKYCDWGGVTWFEYHSLIPEAEYNDVGHIS
jgi:hypothetical protein